MKRGTGKNQNTERKSFRLPLIAGVLMIALLLVGSSVIVWRFAQNQTDDAVYALTEFYLEELAERRTGVITANLNSRKQQMEAAVSGIKPENLESETSLREYLSFIQIFNNLNMFAMVDEEGMIYTASSTYAGISRFGFLTERITETILTVNQAYGSRNMVLIASPVEEVLFQGKKITACFSGIDMDRILDSVSMQTDDNQTYCSIFFRDGRFLTKTTFDGGDSPGSLLGYLEEGVEFDDGYSMHEIRQKLETGEAGFTSFVKQGQHDYLYYTPIEQTDWYLAIFISENIVDEQLENVGDSFVSVSLIQIIVIVAVMAAVFLIIYRTLRSNEIIHYEKLKADEVNRAKQEEAEEKLRLQ